MRPEQLNVLLHVIERDVLPNCLEQNYKYIIFKVLGRLVFVNVFMAILAIAKIIRVSPRWSSG